MKLFIIRTFFVKIQEYINYYKIEYENTINTQHYNSKIHGCFGAVRTFSCICDIRVC